MVQAKSLGTMIAVMIHVSGGPELLKIEHREIPQSKRTKFLPKSRYSVSIVQRNEPPSPIAQRPVLLLDFLLVKYIYLTVRLAT